MNLSRCYRESVDDKSSSMDRDYVEDLLARQKLSRWIKKLSRSYQDKFQNARWIEIVLRFVKKGSLRGLIDKKLSRICREAVELKEKEFIKERKST